MSNVMTPEFRVSYPKVFKPELNKLSGKTEYSLQALFKLGADLTPLKKAALEAINAKWTPEKVKQLQAASRLRSPFRDQGDREKLDEATGKSVMPIGYEKGAIYITLKNAQRPGVVDGNVQPIIDETLFYAGCYARATVRAFAYEQKGNCGVSFSLSNVQKVRDGDPFGSRTKPEDDFAPIAGATDGATAADGSATDLFG
jgi:ssDNA-binding protein